MYTQMRKNERKALERRHEDRRQVDFVFASSKWIQHIEKNYAAWPKNERRNTTRRDGERRDEFQRGQNLSHLADYSSDLLSDEERLYFNELFMNKAN